MQDLGASGLLGKKLLLILRYDYVAILPTLEQARELTDLGIRDDPETYRAVCLENAVQPQTLLWTETAASEKPSGTASVVGAARINYLQYKCWVVSSSSALAGSFLLLRSSASSASTS